MPKITFNNTNNVFFQTLKRSVDSYFISKNLKKTGNWELYLKTWILIPGALGNIIHHTFTNIDGIDDDIANGPLLRQCTTQKWMPIHRFQFLYMFVLYSISTLSWMLRTDFKWYFTRKINNTRINKIDPGQHVLFWASKLLYAFFYIAVPIYFLGWKPWLTGFLIIHFTMGLTLSGWQALYSHIRLMKSLGNKPHTHD